MGNFKVKEYSEFPFKKDNDHTIKECEDLETAKFEKEWYSRRAKMGEKYYVVNAQQPWVVASEDLEKEWRKALDSCGLYRTL